MIKCDYKIKEMRIREDVFAFRRFREYERICSYWQSLSVK